MDCFDFKTFKRMTDLTADKDQLEQEFPKQLFTNEIDIEVNFLLDLHCSPNRTENRQKLWSIFQKLQKCLVDVFYPTTVPTR